MNKTPELLPCPHDGSKVEFCEECDGGCHRIIGNGMEIDLLPTIRQGESLETRRAICAERWNTRVYPPEVQAAIERDTPKKPKRGDPFLCEGDEFICPSCDGHVRRSLLKGNCCCHCGQRLDWKERNTPQKLVKDIRSHHRCPTCESDLVKLIDEPTSCCPVCSQRLDWSE